MKTIIIDNYDSFTYNLVHIVQDLLKEEITVKRNDEFELEDLVEYDKIILSPGPGIPEDAGLLKAVIEKYGPTKQIFGVCLGLQAIGEVYGAQLKNLDKVFHGIQTTMQQTSSPSPIFRDLPEEFLAGRYHSWVIDKESDTSQFHITAKDEKGEIMAIQHKDYEVYAVQFHPESIMTPEGTLMIENFLKL